MMGRYLCSFFFFKSTPSPRDCKQENHFSVFIVSCVCGESKKPTRAHRKWDWGEVGAARECLYAQALLAVAGREAGVWGGGLLFLPSQQRARRVSVRWKERVLFESVYIQLLLLRLSWPLLRGG